MIDGTGHVPLPALATAMVAAARPRRHDMKISIGASRTLIFYCDDEGLQHLGDQGLSFSARMVAGALTIRVVGGHQEVRHPHLRLASDGEYNAATERSRVPGLGDRHFRKTRAVSVAVVGPHQLEITMPVEMQAPVARGEYGRSRTSPTRRSRAPTAPEMPCLRDLVRMVNEHAATDEGLTLDVREGRLFATVMVEYS